jgi:hypothetical protein
MRAAVFKIDRQTKKRPAATCFVAGWPTYGLTNQTKETPVIDEVLGIIIPKLKES